MSETTNRFVNEVTRVMNAIEEHILDMQNFGLYLPEDAVGKRTTEITKQAIDALQRAKKHLKSALKFNSLRSQRFIIFDKDSQEAKYASFAEAQKLLVAIDEGRVKVN